MLKNKINELADKSLLILGFGKEGNSTLRLLRKHFPTKLITIADSNNSATQLPQINSDENISFISGDDYLNTVNDFDVIFKSPGISFKDIAVDHSKITSQTDFFLQCFSSQTIGITGTKGKSTTSTMIYEILNSHNNNTLLVGNIGVPLFDCIDQINDKTLVVAELSSHQLEYITKAPKYSVLLNIYQEHLDHYKSYKDYQLAKFNIARCQSNEDYFIYNADDAIINSLFREYPNIKSQLYPFSYSKKNEHGSYINNDYIYFNLTEAVYDIKSKRHLRGEHNLLNIMAIINVCKLLNIPEQIIVDGINNFKGLPHRIEFVGKYKEIEFYNDSIATIPEAAISAVKSVPNTDTLILGGYDRGINYSELIQFVIKSNISNIIFIDTAGKRIMMELNNFMHNHHQSYFYVNNLDEAIGLAFTHTKPNHSCLLSPAAASYGMFVNFEDRGNQYKSIITQYVKNKK